MQNVSELIEWWISPRKRNPTTNVKCKSLNYNFKYLQDSVKFDFVINLAFFSVGKFDFVINLAFFDLDWAINPVLTEYESPKKNDKTG